jgi:hypothetical protein
MAAAPHVHGWLLASAEIQREACMPWIRQRQVCRVASLTKEEKKTLLVLVELQLNRRQFSHPRNGQLQHAKQLVS